MFRFTIRDLLLVMIGVSLAAAWWIDRRQLNAENQILNHERITLENEYVKLKRSHITAMGILRRARNAWESADPDEAKRAMLACGLFAYEELEYLEINEHH